VEAENRAAQ